MKNLNLNVKDDITAKEALSLTLVLSMLMNRVHHPIFDEYNFHWTVEDVQKMFDLTMRHWKQDSQVKVDGEGKKHYTMECDTGKFGVTTH